MPSKGWGSSRSEEVTIEAYDKLNRKYSDVVTGTWTQSLSIGTKVIWEAGPLVSDPANHCGMTRFAAQLNQITNLEEGWIPLTDSRLRPDLRAREQGRLEDAERHKVRVEEAQRRRRADLEESGKSYEPLFFQISPDGKFWNIKTGQENYWTHRESRFKSCPVPDIFELSEDSQQ